MNGWIRERREKVKLFLLEYGKISLLGFSFLASIFSLFFIVSLSAPRKLSVSFLDVGQGDAILVRTPSGHDMLIDGGPTDAVLTQVAKQMNYFDRQLDVVIATHDDADHVTGLIPVLEKFDVDTAVTSPVAGESIIAEDLHKHIGDERVDNHIGAKGDVIDFGDGVVVHVLYPNKNVSPKTDTNDASVSLVLTYGDISFLLTGDLPSKHEPELLGNNLPKDVTVFKAGHHGSKTSSGEQLLTYLRPEYVVISAGKDNKYGHPNSETVERLQKYAKETLSTIDKGVITFLTDGRIMEVETKK